MLTLAGRLHCGPMADDDDLGEDSLGAPSLTRMTSFVPKGTDKERALKKNESMKVSKKVVRDKEEDEEPSMDSHEQPEGFHLTSMKLGHSAELAKVAEAAGK